MSKPGEPRWRDLENKVRALASYIWNAPAHPERIAGVNVDAVLKIRPDYWICIEVTQEQTLAKLREDLAKFLVVRPTLMAQGVATTCYFVTEFEPLPSIKETADQNKITACSVDFLRRLFFDFAAYRTGRSDRPFGSAIDPDSGRSDRNEYVPVKYQRVKTGVEITLDEIARELAHNRKVVLLGEFGTGKSRCIQELFRLLAEAADSSWTYPLAIDLRENWGLKRATEIIRRHFDDLGLPAAADSVVKAYPSGSICFLLDGFDEIGSQAWGDNPDKLRLVRRQALLGAKDLLTHTPGGVLIAGREHYFNNDEEMFSCLGLDPDKTVVVRCRNEFTPAEMKTFLDRVAKDLELPNWLPRRPLICRTIATLPPESLDEMFAEDGGDVAFWNVLIDTICTREALIRSVLDADTIKNILRLIARATRTKGQNIGPITITEINRSFEKVVGTPPTDESAAILARLPGLGRVGSESEDRQFIDMYILDGLRGLDVDHCVSQHSDGAQSERWTNPLRALGQAIVAERATGRAKPPGSSPALDSYRRLAHDGAKGNPVLAGDIVASVLRMPIGAEKVDFGSLRLTESHLTSVDFASVTPARLHLDTCVVEELSIPTSDPDDTTLDHCIINKLVNVSSSKGVPSWIRNCAIEQFEAVGTVSQIKSARLTSRQRIFLAIVKKTFFQPGGGRKEEALLRGLGRLGDKSERDEVLNLLLTNDILKKFRGDEGWVYAPQREHAHRMKQIIDELSRSKDPLWLEVSK